MPPRFATPPGCKSDVDDATPGRRSAGARGDLLQLRAPVAILVAARIEPDAIKLVRADITHRSLRIQKLHETSIRFT